MKLPEYHDSLSSDIDKTENMSKRNESEGKVAKDAKQNSSMEMYKSVRKNEIEHFMINLQFLTHSKYISQQIVSLSAIDSINSNLCCY